MGPEIIRRKLIILQPKADWETPGNCTLSLPWLLKRPRTYPPRKMNMSPKSISKGRDRLPSIIFEGLLLLVSGGVSLGIFLAPDRKSSYVHLLRLVSSSFLNSIWRRLLRESDSYLPIEQHPKKQQMDGFIMTCFIPNAESPLDPHINYSNILLLNKPPPPNSSASTRVSTSFPLMLLT